MSFMRLRLLMACGFVLEFRLKMISISLVRLLALVNIRVRSTSLYRARLITRSMSLAFIKTVILLTSLLFVCIFAISLARALISIRFPVSLDCSIPYMYDVLINKVDLFGESNEFDFRKAHSIRLAVP